MLIDNVHQNGGTLKREPESAPDIFQYLVVHLAKNGDFSILCNRDITNHKIGKR